METVPDVPDTDHPLLPIAATSIFDHHCGFPLQTFSLKQVDAMLGQIDLVLLRIEDNIHEEIYI